MMFDMDCIDMDISSDSYLCQTMRNKMSVYSAIFINSEKYNRIMQLIVLKIVRYIMCTISKKKSTKKQFC